MRLMSDPYKQQLQQQYAGLQPPRLIDRMAKMTPWDYLEMDLLTLQQWIILTGGKIVLREDKPVVRDGRLVDTSKHLYFTHPLFADQVDIHHTTAGKDFSVPLNIEHNQEVTYYTMANEANPLVCLTRWVGNFPQDEWDFAADEWMRLSDVHIKLLASLQVQGIPQDDAMAAVQATGI